jgi:hypothetical protein
MISRMQCVEVWNTNPRHVLERFAGRIVEGDFAQQATTRVMLPFGDEAGNFPPEGFVLYDWGGFKRAHEFDAIYRRSCDMAMRIDPRFAFAHWAIIGISAKLRATPGLELVSRVDSDCLLTCGLTPVIKGASTVEFPSGELTVIRGVARVSIERAAYVALAVGGVAGEKFEVLRTAVSLSTHPELIP